MEWLAAAMDVRRRRQLAGFTGETQGEDRPVGVGGRGQAGPASQVPVLVRTGS
jgi:purine-nucleoside phosphorylase